MNISRYMAGLLMLALMAGAAPGNAGSFNRPSPFNALPMIPDHQTHDMGFDIDQNRTGIEQVFTKVRIDVDGDANRPNDCVWSNTSNYWLTNFNAT